MKTCCVIAASSGHSCSLHHNVWLLQFLCFVISLSGQHLEEYAVQKREALGDFEIFSTILNPPDYFCALRHSPLTQEPFMWINKIKLRQKMKTTKTAVVMCLWSTFMVPESLIVINTLFHLLMMCVVCSCFRCCPSNLQNSFRRASTVQCSSRKNVQVSDGHNWLWNLYHSPDLLGLGFLTLLSTSFGGICQLWYVWRWSRLSVLFILWKCSSMFFNTIQFHETDWFAVCWSFFDGVGNV